MNLRRRQKQQRQKWVIMGLADLAQVLIGLIQDILNYQSHLHSIIV